jgi:hypothetical protein
VAGSYHSYPSTPFRMRGAKLQLLNVSMSWCLIKYRTTPCIRFSAGEPQNVATEISTLVLLIPEVPCSYLRPEAEAFVACMNYVATTSFHILNNSCQATTNSFHSLPNSYVRPQTLPFISFRIHISGHNHFLSYPSEFICQATTTSFHIFPN